MLETYIVGDFFTVLFSSTLILLIVGLLVADFWMKCKQRRLRKEPPAPATAYEVRSAFMRCLQGGNLAQLKALIYDHPNMNFGPFILEACYFNRADMVDALLEKGGDNYAFHYDHVFSATPLWAACRLGNEKIVARLLHGKRDWVLSMQLEFLVHNPLWIAAYTGHLGCVKHLLACPGSCQLALNSPSYLQKDSLSLQKAPSSEITTPAQIAALMGHSDIHTLLTAYANDPVHVAEELSIELEQDDPFLF